MRISWDQKRFFTQGVSNGVLYPKNSPGVAWSGLSAVTEKGDDSPTTFYIDGVQYMNRQTPGTFSGTISAYTYPDEFEQHNGVRKGLTGQLRPTFGFSWQDNHEIHIVYNALASPSNTQYKTVSEEPDPTELSWDFTTLPVDIPAGRPSSHIVVNTDLAVPDAVAGLEDLLYGDDANSAALPTPLVVYNVFQDFATLKIIDNGDGTWTATGPDEVITISGDEFTIDWSSASFLNDTTYRIHSL